MSIKSAWKLKQLMYQIYIFGCSFLFCSNLEGQATYLANPNVISICEMNVIIMHKPSILHETCLLYILHKQSQHFCTKLYEFPHIILTYINDIPITKPHTYPTDIHSHFMHKQKQQHFVLKNTLLCKRIHFILTVTLHPLI